MALQVSRPMCIDVAVGILIADIELWFKMSFRAAPIHYVLLYDVCGFSC